MPSMAVVPHAAKAYCKWACGSKGDADSIVATFIQVSFPGFEWFYAGFDSQLAGTKDFGFREQEVDLRSLE